jgi:hypothetical protein
MAATIVGAEETRAATYRLRHSSQLCGFTRL